MNTKNSNSTTRIGIIDSGVGGFALLEEFVSFFPKEDFFYICDPQNMPYGSKTEKFIQLNFLKMSNQLIKKNVSSIIIACNTATTKGIEFLREKVTTPIIGVEPYINFINQEDQIKSSKNYALLTTPETFHSKRFHELKLRYDPSSKIDYFKSEKLAGYIETYFYSQDSSSYDLFMKELSFLEEKKYDYLILGCTHYPIIQKWIERQYNIKIIDPAKFIALRLSSVLNLPISKKNNKNNKFMFHFKTIDETQWKLKDYSKIRTSNHA